MAKKSALILWVDEKCRLMNDELSKILTAQLLQSDTYIHPAVMDILSMNNDFDSTGKRDFTKGNEVIYCFRLYQALMRRINMKTFILPTKENFCMFMGWTAKTYQRMVESPNEEVQAAMEIVNDYMVEAMLSAGMSGKTSSTLTKFRSQVSGEHGLGLVTEKEKRDADRQKENMKSKAELLRQLEGFGYKKVKTDAEAHTPPAIETKDEKKGSDK